MAERNSKHYDQRVQETEAPKGKPLFVQKSKRNPKIFYYFYKNGVKVVNRSNTFDKTNITFISGKRLEKGGGLLYQKWKTLNGVRLNKDCFKNPRWDI